MDVADVLLDDPAVALDAFACVLEVELVPIPDVFGVGAVGRRGRPDDVDEQDRTSLRSCRLLPKDSSLPHAEQNRAPSGASAPQQPQIMREES